MTEPTDFERVRDALKTLRDFTEAQREFARLLSVPVDDPTAGMMALGQEVTAEMRKHSVPMKEPPREP